MFFFLGCIIFLFGGITLLLSVFPLLQKELLGNSQAGIECGFSSAESMWAPFSLRFFFLGLLFIVFDIELVLLLVVVFLSQALGWVGGGAFLLLLVYGTLYEMKKGTFFWK